MQRQLLSLTRCRVFRSCCLALYGLWQPPARQSTSLGAALPAEPFGKGSRGIHRAGLALTPVSSCRDGVNQSNTVMLFHPLQGRCSGLTGLRSTEPAESPSRAPCCASSRFDTQAAAEIVHKKCSKSALESLNTGNLLVPLQTSTTEEDVWVFAAHRPHHCPLPFQEQGKCKQLQASPAAMCWPACPELGCSCTLVMGRRAPRLLQSLFL